jgi:hemerythrin
MECKWDQSLATGNSVIDKQHQELFSRMERLVTAAKRGQGKEVVAEAIVFLENYVIEHFRDEENIQMTNSYPEYESHKKQHQVFLNEVMKLKNEFEREGSTVTILVKSIATIGNWLSGHINKRDKALAGYLRGLAKTEKLNIR